MTGRAERHYSYEVYDDPNTAQSFDERRFGGPIGEMLAAEQGRVLSNFVGRIDGRTILDVGTGTGRAALLFACGGAKVTALDASDEMLAVARRRAAEQSSTIDFVRGDAHRLEFRDRAFDVAISLRVLMHTPRWRVCLAELCRVADRLVIIDYPARRSVAVIESNVRRFVHRVGIKTEPYRVFSHREIEREFAAGGFRIRSVHRQFVLPIQLHKGIGSRGFTVRIERLLDRLGLLRVFGSPVTVCAERR